MTYISKSDFQAIQKRNCSNRLSLKRRLFRLLHHVFMNLASAAMKFFTDGLIINAFGKQKRLKTLLRGANSFHDERFELLCRI